MTVLLCPVQLVNYAQFTQTVALRIRNSPVPISNLGNITVLTGMDYRSTNSFDAPHNVSSSHHFHNLNTSIPLTCLGATPVMWVGVMMSGLEHSACLLHRIQGRIAPRVTSLSAVSRCFGCMPEVGACWAGVPKVGQLPGHVS